jgi:hypothetical protein
MYCIVGLSLAVLTVSYRVVSYCARGLPYFLFSIVSLAVRIVSYRIVPYCTPRGNIVRTADRMYCAGFAVHVCVAYRSRFLPCHIVSCRIVLCRIISYHISDSVNIQFSRFVFGSYHNFPRIVSWFLSGSIVRNLRYDLRTTWYDPRGVIGSYSDRNATIWYLPMELAVMLGIYCVDRFLVWAAHAHWLIKDVIVKTWQCDFWEWVCNSSLPW